MNNLTSKSSLDFQETVVIIKNNFMLVLILTFFLGMSYYLLPLISVVLTMVLPVLGSVVYKSQELRLKISTFQAFKSFSLAILVLIAYCFLFLVALLIAWLFDAEEMLITYILRHADFVLLIAGITATTAESFKEAFNFKKILKIISVPTVLISLIIYQFASDIDLSNQSGLAASMKYYMVSFVGIWASILMAIVMKKMYKAVPEELLP